MKKISFLIVLSALLCACQASPESDIIEQKTPNAEVSAVESENGNGIAGYEVPETWQESVTFDNSETKLEINALVEVPAADLLSTYKINEAAGISQERIDALIDEIFGDTVIYDANKEMTKSEVEDMILRLKQQKAEAAAESAESGDGEGNRRGIVMSIMNDGDEQPAIITDRSSMYDRMIEMYEGMLETAPETVEDKPLVINIENAEDDIINFSGVGEVAGKGSYSVSYMASEKNNIAPSLTISNAEYRMTSTEDNEEQNSDNAPTKDEAVAKAEEIISKLGLTGMVINEVTFAEQVVNGDMFSGFGETEKTGKYGYIIEFSREVDGIKCIKGDNFGGLSISEGRRIGGNGGNGGGNGGGGNLVRSSVMTSGAARATATNVVRGMTNDVLSISVTADGIEEISWSGYFEVGDTITQDVGLLPFDEIKELFKKNMGLTYTARESTEFEQFFTMNNISDTYNIYKASLCYTKTAIQNDSDNSMLTPVWAFYSYQVDENGTERYGQSPVMIINAADGSVV